MIGTYAQRAGRTIYEMSKKKIFMLCPYLAIMRRREMGRWDGFLESSCHKDFKNEKIFPKFPKKKFRIFSGFSRFEANRVKFFGINRIRACHAIIINPPIASNDLQTALKAENVIAGCRIFFDISTALCVPMRAREIQTYSAWERELMKIASDDEEFYDMANFSG